VNAEYRVTFQLWLGGVLADVDSIVLGEHDLDGIEEMASRHADLCIEATARGVTYLIDIGFWDGEHVRWGTDVDGMVVPVEVGLADLLDAIARRWE